MTLPSDSVLPTPKLVRSHPPIFASRFLKIRDKDQRVVPLQFNEVQRHYLSRASRRDLVLKARQFGFSTLFQAELFRLATTRRVTTATLGNDDDNTQKMRRIMQCFYDHLPQDFRPDRTLDNARIMTVKQTGSQVMIGTAGNKNTGRGGTYSHIHGSEVAFWPDAESIIAASLQAGNPVVALESTPNGAQGWFYERCMEALDGGRDWRLHFYPWWWGADYMLPLDPDEEIVYSDEEAALADRAGLSPEQIKWRRSKQRELKHLFPQEYPEDPRSCFLLSGSSFFGNLEGVYTAPFYEKPSPQEGHVYVGGLDWGQMADYTVLSIGDATTKEQVHLRRINKMPWSLMREQIARDCIHWNVSMLWAEINSASSNVEELADLFPSVTPFSTTNETKTRGVNGLYEALHSDGWKLQPVPEQKQELAAFQAKQLSTGTWTYAAPSGQHDDIVIADMLMVHGASQPIMSEWKILS